MNLGVEIGEQRTALTDETPGLVFSRAGSEAILPRPVRARNKLVSKLADDFAHVLTHIKALISLTKPEVLSLVLIASGAGCVMATDTVNWATLFHVVLGTALVAGGAATLNQHIERAQDARMRRTANRPLPAGRLTPDEALVFGISLSLIGTAYLALSLNLLTSLIGVAALLSYLLLYTPLKRRTTLATLVGAFPGAAPILMGWAAARGNLGLQAWALYAILFFWQFPHFLAIGWIYRDDYARARMLMLPGKGDGKTVIRYLRITTIALIVASLMPTSLGITGRVYWWSAFALALGLSVFVHRLAARRSKASALHVLHATVIYLPLLFLFMVLDKAGQNAPWPR
jgi:protoheme IX farnesyltransferase